MPVEEQQVQQFLQVIQGGAQFPISSAEMLTADNGDPLFNVVNQTTYAWNGLVADAYAIVTLGGAAVATGMGLLTAPVSAPVVAIGLALGLTSGYLLYDLQPEFFNDIATQLEEAGQTIGGKVIGFINESGITGYTEQTIDIIKNALLAYGAYDTTIEKPELPAPQQYLDISYYYGNHPYTEESYRMARSIYDALNYKKWSVIVSGANLYDRVTITTGYYPWTDGGSIVGNYFIKDSISVIWRVNASSYNQIVMALEMPDDYVNHNYYFTIWGGIDHKTYTGGNGLKGSLRKINNKWWFIYYLQAGNATIEQNNITPDICSDISNTEMAIYGLLDKLIVEDAPGVQDGATIPTGDPISTTYPNWEPWQVPQEIPDIYPVSEPIPDGEQDPAQTGENDEPDQIQSLWEKIFIPDAPTPIEPEPEPDPDPQPEPDPIPEPEPAEPLPDPINPNPPIEPSPLPVVPVLPAMVDSNAMFTVYRPSISQLNNFGGWLWSANIIDQLLRMWSNPLEGIIAFQKVYASPTVGAASNIIVGYLDSGVAAPIVTSQFTTIDCGTIDVAEKMHNATDYSPYTSMHLYLPFIGIVELDITEFMGGSINVKYSIDVYTGTCLAEVRAIREADMPNATIIYTFSGNASQQLPLTSSNFAGAISALVSAVGGGISIASGGGLGVVAGIKSIGHSLTHEMIHIGKSGALSSNAGIMAVRTPFIILGRRNGYDANGYNELYGYPANKTVYLSNCNGFTRIKAGFLRSKATENEKSEIMSFLEKGVIL